MILYVDAPLGGYIFEGWCDSKIPDLTAIPLVLSRFVAVPKPKGVHEHMKNALSKESRVGSKSILASLQERY